MVHIPIIHDFLCSVQEQGLVDVAPKRIPVIPTHLRSVGEPIVTTSEVSGKGLRRQNKGDVEGKQCKRTCHCVLLCCETYLDDERGLTLENMENAF